VSVALSGPDKAEGTLSTLRCMPFCGSPGTVVNVLSADLENWMGLDYFGVKLTR
jgi:hypothetical protein